MLLQHLSSRTIAIFALPLYGLIAFTLFIDRDSPFPDLAYRILLEESERAQVDPLCCRWGCIPTNSTSPVIMLDACRCFLIALSVVNLTSLIYSVRVAGLLRGGEGIIGHSFDVIVMPSVALHLTGSNGRVPEDPTLGCLLLLKSSEAVRSLLFLLTLIFASFSDAVWRLLRRWSLLLLLLLCKDRYPLCLHS